MDGPLFPDRREAVAGVAMVSPVGVGLRRVGAACGVVGVFGNVVAVLLLGDMPSAYRVARLNEWVRAVGEQPAATTTSSVAFTVGLVALAGWALVLARSLVTPVAVAGGALVAFGALANSVGTLTPAVQALHVGSCGEACDAVGRALLGFSLSLDALFNFTLGVGLLLMATTRSLRAPARALMALAAIASLPVAAQFVNDSVAEFLYVAAPLWLTAMLVTSVDLWRQRG